MAQWIDRSGKKGAHHAGRDADEWKGQVHVGRGGGHTGHVCRVRLNRERERERERWGRGRGGRMGLYFIVGRLTSLQYAGASQEQICLDNRASCQTEGRGGGGGEGGREREREREQFAIL